MSSVRQLEDTLPLTAPDTNQKSTTFLGRKYAVYLMQDISSRQLDEALQVLNTNDNNVGPGDCRLAAQSDFSGKSLRNIYDHHIATRDNEANWEIFHPFYFIVIDHKHWSTEGVLFVNLAASTDVGQTVVGVCRCAVAMANSMGANLEIANIDWLEFKEEECDEWGGENPYTNPRYCQQEVEKPASEQAWKYAWWCSVVKAVPINGMLEPGWGNMKRGESRFWFRGHCGDDMVEARRDHPFTCLMDHKIHRQFVLVAMKEAANEEEGVAICRLDWDGNLDGYSYDESTHEGQNRDRPKVQAIMPEIVVLEKVKASDALATLDEYVAATQQQRPDSVDIR